MKILLENSALDERRRLPEGWEWKKIGDVGILHDGDWILNKDYSENGVRLIQVGDIGIGKFIGKSKRFISIKTAEELKCTFVNSKEDILISRMPDPIGRACLSPDLPYPYIVAVDVTIFKLNKKMAEPKYIVYSVNNPKLLKEIDKYALGATRKRISRTNLEQIEIPLPSLPTQRHIVSILEKAEETKRLRAQADELTDRLLQSVFMEMFGDPVKNPKGWDVKKIDDIIISIEAGWSVNGEQRPLKEDELGVLKVSAVTKGVFLSSENKAISKSQILKKVINPEKGDLLFSRANTRELVGATCLIDKNYPNLLLPDKLWKIKPDKKQLISEYFKFILSNPAIRKIISNNATGTSGSMYNISMNKLKSISIPIPPLLLQQKFARIVEKIESMRQSQNQSKQQIEDLFGALMQKAFRGEI